MNGCRIQGFRDANQSHNVLIRGGGQLVTVNTALPSGGNTGLNLGSGGSWVKTDNGVTEWIGANGTNTQGPPS